MFSFSIGASPFGIPSLPFVLAFNANEIWVQVEVLLFQVESKYLKTPFNR